MNTNVTNLVSGNTRVSRDPIWIIAAKNNLKSKVLKVTDLDGVTRIYLGNDAGPSKRVLKTKAERKHQASLRKEIECRKNITFLN